MTERVPLASSYQLSTADLQAEGLAYDPVTRAFFAGSLSYGSVTRIAANGDERLVFEREDALRLTLGLHADPEHRNLWVCSIVDDDKKSGTVLQINLDSFELSGRHELGSVFETASCNDVTTDDDGVAYVTDRENPHIYRIDPATGQADTWLAHDALEPGLVGMNGIVITGDTMIVTKYSAPKLYAIPMGDPEAVQRIDLDGDWLHVFFKPLAGADGLELFEGELYLAFDAAAFRITPKRDDWTEAQVEKLDGVDTHGGLSAIVAAEGTLYGSNGQAPRYLLGRSPDPASIWTLLP